jgi:hypothetical protein
MRELFREGVLWSVHEANTSHVPGARGRRCLIFDSDTVVRRVWSFPTDWHELDDDALWALIARPAPSSARGASTRAPTEPFASAMALAEETTATARALVKQISTLREANRTLLSENSTLRAQCQDGRCAMRHTVEAYASAMRAEGLAPEVAIVRIKTAVIDAVGAASVADDPDAETVMRDAVAWGIAAYYAA